MVVLPDADVDMAADAAVSAAYGSAGERCMAIATVVAVGDVADPLVDAIASAAAEDQGRAGHGPDGRDGPARHREHRDKVASYLDSGAAQGATVVVDGRDHPLDDERRLLPRRLAHRPRQARDGRLPGRDLRSGPDASSASTTYEEAVDLVNDNPYGNGTAIFTRDGGAARAVPVRGRGRHGRDQRPDPGPGRVLQLRRLEDSLFGDLHMYGPEGIQFYTRAKVVDPALAGPGDLEGRS